MRNNGNGLGRWLMENIRTLILAIVFLAGLWATQVRHADKLDAVAAQLNYNKATLNDLQAMQAELDKRYAVLVEKVTQELKHVNEKLREIDEKLKE